jgi:isoleucyl-tRNA synthetase
MWMDWDNDYYTFSDTNIEYIWRFLKEVHRRGWLFQGTGRRSGAPLLGRRCRSTSRPGEGNYEELEHPSLYVRFPAEGPRGRVARRVDDDAVDAAGERRRRGEAGRRVRPRDGGWRLAETGASTSASRRGEELVGLEYSGPFDELPAQEASSTGDPVGRGRARRGHGHRPHRAGRGTEDFELSKVHDLPVIAPINESGRFYPGSGPRGDVDDRGEEPVIAALRGRGLLVEAGRITHRYPICWRCRTPLVFRVVDDWFIGVDEIREQLRERTDGRVDAAAIRQADGRLAREHGRLEHLAEALLRPAAALLPVRVRASERRGFAGGTRAAGGRRARAAA